MNKNLVPFLVGFLVGAFLWPMLVGILSGARRKAS